MIPKDCKGLAEPHWPIALMSRRAIREATGVRIDLRTGVPHTLLESPAGGFLLRDHRQDGAS